METTRGRPVAKKTTKKTPEKKKGRSDYSIAKIARLTRESLFKAAESMVKQSELISDRINKELEKDIPKSQSITQLLTSQGIMIDKQNTILRQLRGLESEAGEDLEACFVIIEEDKDGNRRVVGSAPELPALAGYDG